MLRSSALKKIAVGSSEAPFSSGTGAATPSIPTTAIAELDVPKSRPRAPVAAPSINDGSRRRCAISMPGIGVTKRILAVAVGPWQARSLRARWSVQRLGQRFAEAAFLAQDEPLAPGQ